MFVPEQTGDTLLTDKKSCGGEATVAVAVAVQPALSVIVKVCVPAQRFVVEGEYVYGGVPPLVLIVTCPSHVP